MLDLMNKIRPASHANDFPVKVNIEENLAVEEIRANTRLWFDGSQPIGWAYVDDLHNLHWELEKQYSEPVGAEMVEWGESVPARLSQRGNLHAGCELQGRLQRAVGFSKPAWISSNRGCDNSHETESIRTHPRV